MLDTESPAKVSVVVLNLFHNSSMLQTDFTSRMGYTNTTGLRLPGLHFPLCEIDNKLPTP